jgi:hypothetical protein
MDLVVDRANGDTLQAVKENTPMPENSCRNIGVAVVLDPALWVVLLCRPPSLMGCENGLFSVDNAHRYMASELYPGVVQLSSHLVCCPQPVYRPFCNSWLG